jgi:hypothetical protein
MSPTLPGQPRPTNGNAITNPRMIGFASRHSITINSKRKSLAPADANPNLDDSIAVARDHNVYLSKNSMTDAGSVWIDTIDIEQALCRSRAYLGQDAD